jgi:hypothetical protein
MHVWYQGSKAACEGLQLDVQLQEQLGKGGFGAVRRVRVKATGDNSLASLKLTGPLQSSLKNLVKAHKAKTKGSRTAAGGAGGGRGGAAAAGGGGAGGRGGAQAAARSRAGSRAGSRGGGSNGGAGGGSDGSSDGGAWVPMALKVSLSFEQLSRDMQDNFRERAFAYACWLLPLRAFTRLQLAVWARAVFCMSCRPFLAFCAGFLAPVLCALCPLLRPTIAAAAAAAAVSAPACDQTAPLTASLFDANVQQRMREEYDVMTACAASPHILDAFCMGSLWLAGSWRPCILMEVRACF